MVMRYNMEGVKKIIIEAEVKEDNRLHLNFSKFKDDTLPNRFELLSIMVSGLSMVTRVACKDLNYEKQGEIIHDVFNSLKKELFNGDSFKDLNIMADEL